MAELEESFVHRCEATDPMSYVRVNEADGRVYVLSVFGESAIDLPFTPDEALKIASSLIRTATAALKKR